MTGRDNARELGLRRRDDGLAAVFTSDLARALETVAIAFGDSGIPVLVDWRLRECDYGSYNGGPVGKVHTSYMDHLDEPYPGGESWRQATDRIRRFLDDLPSRWDGARVLVVGHVATRWGLECSLNHAELAQLAGADFTWRPGWEYCLGSV